MRDREEIEVNPGDRHVSLFCGCVETEQFVPALRYIHNTLELTTSPVNHQKLSELMNGEMAAYLLLTEMERRGILEHGSSIRNCWYDGDQKGGVHPRELILALILECNQVECPYCNCPLDVQFSSEGIAQYWCQNCCQVIKESGKK